MNQRLVNQLQLNQSNYHSLEADREYFSVSQFKNMVECSAREIARLNEEYVRSESPALTVGSYTHAAFESAEVFIQFHKDNSESIFGKTGKKYAEYVMADAMIETVKNDPFCMFAMDGETEQIYTAEMYGAKWKIKVDSINHERKTFTDLKTTQSLYKRYWSDKYGKFVSFVEAWDYTLQMAIYRKVLELNTGTLYNPFIVAVTKENPPDKAVLHFDESRFSFELDTVEYLIPRFIEMKFGREKPVRCEKCEYCRSSKKLKDTIEIAELMG